MLLNVNKAYLKVGFIYLSIFNFYLFLLKKDFYYHMATSITISLGPRGPLGLLSST